METSIAWTDYTFNPWWGCTRVSPGCENCYAETFSHRLGLDLWGPTGGRRFFDDKHWAQPLNWARRRRNGDARHRVFCASMADVFELRPSLTSQRERLWKLIEATPELTWQLLTKRPSNVMAMLPDAWRSAETFPRNVWMLTTAEDQQRADERIPELLKIPAGIHGVSYEPALGPLDLMKVHRDLAPTFACRSASCRWSGPRDERPARSLSGGVWAYGVCPECRGPVHPKPSVDWIIVGGESGHNARPFELQWARDVIDQATGTGVKVFVKQLGAHASEIARPRGVTETERRRWLADGWTSVVAVDHEFFTKHPRLRDSKGGDPIEWPEELRVREFPA